MSQKNKIIFFGSSNNSLLVLKELHQAGFNIPLVVTSPPKPVGRKQILTKTSVHTWAEQQGILVQTPATLKTKQIENWKLKIDNSAAIAAAVVADYALKIPTKLLKLPKHGFINLHPSLLPKYRGSTPAQAAILNGDKTTGISIIQMSEHFDEGAIISWTEEPVLKDDTAQSLYARLFSIGSEILVTILPAWIEEKIIARPQPTKEASYAYRLTRAHGFINWKTVTKAMSGKSISLQDINPQLQNYLKDINYKLKLINYKLIERTIRAFHPWPGVWTTIKTDEGEKRLKILSSHTQNGKLVLDKVQLEGKTSTPFNQLLYAS